MAGAGVHTGNPGAARDGRLRKSDRGAAHYQRMRGRVVRLATVSSVVLGFLWWLSLDVEEAGPAVDAMLLAGWALMPAVLVASLFEARLRYLLAVPASLVSVGVLWLAVLDWPSAGWSLVTAGILLGGLLGAWFWFGWAPVPAALEEPSGRWRWGLIGVHVGLIVIGMGLVAGGW